MKKSEIQRCLKGYQAAIGAFANLEAKLQASKAAADGLPLLRRTIRRLDEADQDLQVIGDGLSLLPELAEHLLEQLRICAMLRRQAEEAGFVFRYDLDAEPA